MRTAIWSFMVSIFVVWLVNSHRPHKNDTPKNTEIVQTDPSSFVNNQNISLLSVNESSFNEEISSLVSAVKGKIQKGLDESLKKALEENHKYQELRDELTKGLAEFAHSAESLQVRIPDEHIKKLKNFGQVAGIADLLQTKEGDSRHVLYTSKDVDHVAQEVSAKDVGKKSSTTDGNTELKVDTAGAFTQVRKQIGANKGHHKRRTMARNKHHESKSGTLHRHRKGASKPHAHRKAKKTLHGSGLIEKGSVSGDAGSPFVEKASVVGVADMAEALEVMD